MAAKDDAATTWRLRLLWLFLALIGSALAGRHHHNSGIEKLLAAGLIAKALSKGGEEGGGGGGHHFVPVHIPVHHGHHHHHHGRHAAASHHVHHKYVPIPVKHHTNFIIAHHKVHVPVVKTKVVHVPVEQTRIVPIIVHPDGKKPRATAGVHTSHRHQMALASDDRKVRVTSLGTVKQVKSNNSTSLQFRKPSSSSRNKWIVVVKTKRRPSSSRNR